MSPRAIGIAIVFGLLAVYLLSNFARDDVHNHFVWQASAWLQGQTSIPYPVFPAPGSPGNNYFQDVLPILDSAGHPTGRAILPFPPLPALVLLPFVAVFGLATPAQLIATFLGAIDVAIVYWALGSLAIRTSTRVATTFLVGLGTAFWYAAKLGSTWYLAHIVAFGLTVAAVGLVLQTVIPRAAAGRVAATGTAATGAPATGTAATGAARGSGFRARLDGHPRLGPLDLWFLAAGFLFGLACTARLSIVFGAPFFLLIAGPRALGGRAFGRRSASAALGAAVPILALLAYNLAATGHALNPAYDYLYQREALGYPELGYHPEWAIEDVRYIPDHLRLMLFGPPGILPPCDPTVARTLFGPACPVAEPDPVGMGLLLTSPAYVLAFAAFRRPLGRAVAAGAIAAGTIALFDLAHFSQGWVQFGYRFSLDFLPFLLPAIALGIDRVGARSRWTIGLIAISVAVNAWGVAWGGILGW